MGKTFGIIAVVAMLILSIQNVSAASNSFKEIYANKQAALKTLNVKEVSKYMTSSNITAIKKEKDPKAVIFLMNHLSPLKYTTGKETINGDTASMEISGTARNPALKGQEDTFSGNIYFKKEGSEWKVEKEELNFKNKSNMIRLRR